jgi:transcriptional regulator with XRE-family HTH domain
MDGPRIGAAIGVGKSAISNWRNGYAAPAYENLEALTRLAGMVLRLESADPDKASRMDVAPDERAILEDLRAIRRIDSDAADNITANIGDQLRSWRSRLSASGRASG